MRRALAFTEGFEMPTHDRDSALPSASFSSSDDHGRAALLLVESLIHELCAKSALTADEALVAAERAIDVLSDQAEAADGAGAPLWRSHALLQTIASSLRIDSSLSPAQRGQLREVPSQKEP